jgi:hypothetical protein
MLPHEDLSRLPRKPTILSFSETPVPSEMPQQRHSGGLIALLAQITS